MKRLALCLLLLGGSLSTLGAQTKAPVNAPAPIYPIPTPAQLEWHKLETYAFIHFGLNTYNDLEWGYGNTPTQTFAPKSLDCEQWVKTLKAAGMKGVILTAKHHDGFCLWPTETTSYSVKASPWKNGQGDLVRDLSDACRKHGLRFGLYLSPWDRNHAEYGREGYQRVFHEQIRELTSNYGELFEYWFDGANGGTGWYGGANEARSINPKSYYKYEEAGNILRKNNPNIMIFGGTEPTIRWIGNEAGWAGETNWAMYDHTQEKHHKEAQWGMREAKYWIPGEVDVSIRPGWFYHQREDHQVRSVANLVNLYHSSVGRGANLLLNFPVNLDGKIPQEDSINIVQWRKVIDDSFRINLLKRAKPSALHTRKGRPFRLGQLTDANLDTYWATEDGHSTADVTFRFKRAQRMNSVMLQEHIALGQRIEAFELSYQGTDGTWRPLPTQDSLTTIGYKRIIRSSTVEAQALRLQVTKAKGVVCLSEMGAYLTPLVAEAPSVYRDEQDTLHIISSLPTAQVSYRIINAGQGGQWLSYTGPIHLAGDNLQVEAKIDNITAEYRPDVVPTPLGISASKISTPNLNSDERRLLLDGRGHTAVHLGKGRPQEIHLVLSQPTAIQRIVYTPDQRRDASGHIQNYQLYIDGQKVTEGEFSNIKNNPIPMEIRLPSQVIAKDIRLVSTRNIDGQNYTSIGGIALLAE